MHLFKHAGVLRGFLFADENRTRPQVCQRGFQRAFGGEIGRRDEILRTRFGVNLVLVEHAEARHDFRVRDFGDAGCDRFRIDRHARRRTSSGAAISVALGNALKNCPATFALSRARMTRRSSSAVSSMISAR